MKKLVASVITLIWFKKRGYESALYVTVFGRPSNPQAA